MGMFDDLVPGGAKPATPSGSGGMFSDLIPKQPAGPDYGASQFKQMGTDILPEMGREFMAGASDVGGMFDLDARAKDVREKGLVGAELSGLGRTARGVMGVPRMLLSPVTGAINAIGGHGLAGVEQAVGSVINPARAAELQNDPQLYEKAKGDVGTALMAAMPGRGLPPGGPATALRPPTIGDFAVPLTKGEAAGDASQIALERRALRAGASEPEQKTAQQFMEDREARLGQVRSDISQSLSPTGREIAQTPYEAGEIIQSGLEDAAARVRERRNARYEEMRGLPGEFHAGAFEGMGQRIRGELTLGDHPVIIDDRTTPIATQMLHDVDQQLGSLRVQNHADPFGAPNRENIIGVNLQGVDQARKRLVTMYKDARTFPPTADTRAAKAVLDAFDGQIERAIERGLFSGDPRALDALREARAAHSEYMRMFGPRASNDDVGRVIRNMLGSPDREAMSPSQIANYLYGAAKIGGKDISVRLASRLEEIFGRASPEMIGVRQGMWRRMTEKPEGVSQWGPQQVVNNISHFLSGDGQYMANRMFTPQQLNLMRRYRDVLQQTIPPPGAVNYSNNVPMLSALRHGVSRLMMGLMGSHIGGMVGAAAGYAAHAAGMPIINLMKARKLEKAMPTLASSMQRWNQAMVKAQAGQASPQAVRAATREMLAIFNKAGISEDELRKP